MIHFKTFTKIVGDLDKLIVAKGFKKLPKVQLIAQSGHTEDDWTTTKCFASEAFWFAVV